MLMSAYLHVELEDGRMISTPMVWYPELKNATLTQLTRVPLHLPKDRHRVAGLDYQLSIAAMFSAETKLAKAA